MGHQVAKSSKAPKQRRARLSGDMRPNVVKNMNRAPSGGWNQARENLRRVAQRLRKYNKRTDPLLYRPMPISAWMRFVTRLNA